MLLSLSIWTKEKSRISTPFREYYNFHQNWFLIYINRFDFCYSFSVYFVGFGLSMVMVCFNLKKVFLCVCFFLFHPAALPGQEHK